MLTLWMAFVLAFAQETPPEPTMKPGLLIDLQAFAADHKSAGLRVQRLRPGVRGELLDGTWRYAVQAEFAGESPSLLDAAVQWRPVDGFLVQVGRFLVPYSRSQSTPVPKLQFHGFANSTNQERHGRDLGVRLGLARGPVDAQVGVFQASAAVPGAGPLVVGRASVDVFGSVPLDEGDAAVNPEGEDGLSFGIGGRAGWDVRPDVLDVLGSTGGALDFALRVEHTRWQGEGFVRHWSDGLVQGGGYVQGSVAPVPQLELGARADVWRTDQTAWTVQGLGSWYAHGQHARLSLQVDTGREGLGVQRFAVALQPQVWL